MIIFKKILFLLFIGGVLLLSLTGTLFAQQQNLNTVLEKAQKYGIKKPTLTELQQRAQVQGLNDEQLIELIQPAIDMAEQDLPADFALEKAMEGLSKNIPASSIIPLLQRIDQTAAEAAQIVNAWLKKPGVKKMVVNSWDGMSEEEFRNELIRVTAKALNKNISEETVNEIFEEMEDERVLVKTSPSDIVAAMGVLSNMSQGVDQSQSAKFVVQALKGGFTANELKDLPFKMSMAQQRGELPAASVIESVSEQLNGGVPAKKILQNLFAGELPGSIPKGLKNRSDRGSQGNSGN